MTRPRALAAHLRAAGITATVKGRVVSLEWGGVALTMTDNGEGPTITTAPELLKADLTRRAVRLRLAFTALADLPSAAAEALAQAEPGQEELTRREILAVIAERKRSAVDSATYQLARKEEALSAAQREISEAQAVHAQALKLDAAVLAVLGSTP
jgi:hypothetical protein